MTRRPYQSMLISLFLTILLLNYHKAMADDNMDNFYYQCQKYTAVASDFYKTCIDRARPYERTFYPGGGVRGEVESFRFYLNPIQTPTRFLLGCVVNANGKLNYVGMYYSHAPLTVAESNMKEAVFVDYDDSIGIAPEGRQVTLIAIRQFASDVIPERFPGFRKNCEKQGMENFGDIKANIHYGYRYEYKAGNYIR